MHWLKSYPVMPNTKLDKSNGQPIINQGFQSTLTGVIPIECRGNC